MKSVYWKFYVVVAFRVWFRNLAIIRMRQNVKFIPGDPKKYSGFIKREMHKKWIFSKEK